MVSLNNNSIEKGQQLWSSIDKYMFDTIEALDNSGLYY
jgi:hypothetical protein